jgi:pimeloyl-ACP methyl ester carboxylesterase
VVSEGSVEVAGCAIGWTATGDERSPALVAVHGMRAHRHWWDGAIEAGLARDHRVFALDLSGHGDSGRRPSYSPELWADEVLAVIESAAGGRAVLVGHSMGGLVALVAAARRPDLVSALVLVETSIRIPDPEDLHVPRGTPPKSFRTFADREEAIASFRLFPPQPVVDEGPVARLAERSVMPVGDRWGWKFDTGVARRFTDDLINRHLAKVRCPVAMVRGEASSLVSTSSVRAAEQILGRAVPETVVPGGHHHLIVDQPAASAAAIDAALVELGPLGD